jgi:hypothetical protein
MVLPNTRPLIYGFVSSLVVWLLLLLLLKVERRKDHIVR